MTPAPIPHYLLDNYVVENESGILLLTAART